MAKEQNSYFRKISNPRGTRRTILENTRDVLKVLQGYEEYKKIRDERTRLVNSFRLRVDELQVLLSEMKKTLPKTASKEIRKQIMPKMAVIERPEREIKKLEAELADIEDKLGQI